MADIDSGGGGGRGRKGGGSKTKKQSTRIDMTAMVDVAFLLLTFFVLTAVITDEAKMDLVIPPEIKPEDQKDAEAQVDEDKIVTLILDEDDKLRWYHGSLSQEKLDEGTLEIHTSSYDHTKGLGKIVKDHMHRYPDAQHPNKILCRDLKANKKVEKLSKEQKKTCWDPIFVIKPRYLSKYRNLVDLLDEMAIYDVPKYAIAKYSETDSLYVHLYDSLRSLPSPN